MTQRLPAFDVDLRIEHAGRSLELRGSGTRLAAAFPALADLFHFARIGWSVRRHVPGPLALTVRWRWFHVSITLGRRLNMVEKGF